MIPNATFYPGLYPLSGQGGTSAAVPPNGKRYILFTIVAYPEYAKGFPNKG